jgi:formylglycine-generating enzyme required for sulfatase activity/serine/threonine protein kinase
MAISIACPNCLRVVYASRKEAGMSKPCPGCGQLLVIPPRSSREPEKPTKLNCPQCNCVLRLVKYLHGKNVRCNKCDVTLAVSAHPWQLSVVNSEYIPSAVTGSPQRLRTGFELHVGEPETPLGNIQQQESLSFAEKSDSQAKEPPSLASFVQSLIDSGLMSANNCQSYLESLPESTRPQTALQLVEQMRSQEMLTKLQAEALFQGKTRGLVIGNYVVLDRLGHGGMGCVYKAKHLRMDRVVAIKVLPRNATKSPWAVKCFQREARAAAKLSHPNIVMAYDADEADGVHFLVMEFIDGQDLASAVMQNGPLTVADAVNCLVQAAHGLEFAHGKGVIHRDIKPANLLLDKQGNIKILDLGLAHIEEDIALPDCQSESSTNSGHVIGTLEYMSPEQALDTKLASARSDIYSLGCSLYYLLVGHPPFRCDTMAKKILAHCEQPIPSLRIMRGDVPESLDFIFHRMMAKNPQDRQQSMAILIAELHGIHLPQNGTPVPLPIPLKRDAETLGPHIGDINTPPEPADNSAPVPPAGNTGQLSQPAHADDNFNPYYSWLGIPPEDQPPNHYRLLAIDLFQSDPGVIEAAAKRQTAYVHPHAAGKHIEQSQKLLNEITEARLCLLDPKKRALYDLQLRVNLAQRARLSGKNHVAPKPAPLPTFITKEPPPSSEPTANAENGISPAPSEKLAKKSLFSNRHWWTNPVILTMMGCFVLILILTLCLKLFPDKIKPAELPPKPSIYYVKLDPPEAVLTVENNLGFTTGTGRQREIRFDNIPQQAEVHIMASYKGYEDDAITLHPALVESKNPSITLKLKKPPEPEKQTIIPAPKDANPPVTVEPAIFDVRIYPPKARLIVQNNLGTVAGTGSDRKVQINNFPAQGRVNIIASCDGYQPCSQSLTLNLPDSEKLSFTLKKDLSEKTITLDLGNKVKMYLVLIPPGSFLMGDNDNNEQRYEKPPHKVTITQPFYIGKYEVTQAQWEVVMGKNPSSHMHPQNPVENVSWDDCQVFLKKLEEKFSGTGAIFGLPTEAQWEYACRAGSTSQYCFRDSMETLADYAWFRSNSDEDTHPVGKKKSNAWSLYDMHGNVAEWCADWYDPDYYEKSPAQDPTGPLSGTKCVLRGGNYFNNTLDCRAAYRSSDAPQSHSGLVGFRLICVYANDQQELERHAQDRKPAVYAVQIDPPSANLELPDDLYAHITGEGKQRIIFFDSIPRRGKVRLTALCDGYKTYNQLLAPKPGESQDLSIVLGKELPEKIITLDLGKEVKMEMVMIHPGSFMMGDDEGRDEEQPVHKVTITRPFYIGKYEVTQEQWETVMSNNPSSVKNSQFPVDRLRWSDCQEFLKKLQKNCAIKDMKFTLPTEAQWEYACRAGSSSKYYFGDSEKTLGKYAWFVDNSQGNMHPVGQKNANAWGLYDMYGNVWEWCADWYDAGYYGRSPQSDPTGAPIGTIKILRGGCWDNAANKCLSAYRLNTIPFNDRTKFGFRVACIYTVDPK